MSIVLIAVGEYMLFNTFMYEVRLGIRFKTVSVVERLLIQNEINKGFFGFGNIIHGMWTVPLCLGIVLLLDSINCLPNIDNKEIYKRLKHYVKWKIKQGIKQYKEWRGEG